MYVEVRLSQQQLESLLNERAVINYKNSQSGIEVVLIPEKKQLTIRQIIKKLESCGMGDLANQLENLKLNEAVEINADGLTCSSCDGWREKAKTCVKRKSERYRLAVIGNEPACKYIF